MKKTGAEGARARRMRAGSEADMSKESEYQAQMEAAGIWLPAFAGAVHDLCMLERDQAKTRTAWRAALGKGDKANVELMFEILMKQDQKIQALREALCLTPRALQKVREDFGSGVSVPNTPAAVTVLDKVRKRREA